MSQEQLMSIVVKNIKHFRLLKNLSQLKLEQLANLGENYLTNIETQKKTDMNISTLNKIAIALEIDIQELFIVRDEYQDKSRVDQKINKN